MGIKKNIIKKDNYKDSVFLMAIASEIEKIDGVDSTSLMMGTTANKEILETSGLLLDEGKASKENDLIIAIDATDEDTLNKALSLIEEKFSAQVSDEDTVQSKPPSIEEALSKNNDLNFVLISVAGQYAAREANKALDNGLHVMMFSDNVSLEEEVQLKKKAFDLDLLLMGPDCGTAIVNGVPLGFANRVPAGDIGIVAASGTGLQEVSVTIAKYGCGITQAFGTGGRDLSKEVGGLSMLKSIDYLAEDPDTKVIVLVSKPPHPEIAEKIIQRTIETSKPAVICFLGSDAAEQREAVYFTQSLEATGIIATQLSNNTPVETGDFTIDNIDELVSDSLSKIAKGSKYIRGLYSGGTLCDETIDIINENGVRPYSNAGKDEEYFLDDPFKSKEHTLVDMGEDIFTRGRPHPMIDLSFRNKRILEEANDPETAIILFDLVLGYGANADPAGAMADTLNKIKDSKLMIASVCGTDLDPQNYTNQVKILKDCGVVVLPTNAQAARFTAQLVNKL